MMKIVSWNCNGGLRKKIDALDALEADLYIVQECENPELSTKKYREWAGDYLWIGSNKNKGIGVFPKKGNSIQKLNWNGEFTIPGFSRKSKAHSWRSCELESFLPFSLNGDFRILAVWTKQARSPVFGYIGQFWKYLQAERKNIGDGKTIICGDFNSNSIWDKPDRWWNHSDVVEELEELGIGSLFHAKNDVKFGQEQTPTFCMYRKIEKPFHIDYVFMPKDLISKAELEIGDPNFWLEYSDHFPLIFNF